MHFGAFGLASKASAIDFMVDGRVMLGAIICLFFLSWCPVKAEFLLCFMAAEPVISKVHIF